MKKAVLNFLDGLLNIFLVVMLLINLFYIVERNINKVQLPKIFGMGYAIVISGSMAPAINVDDVVYIKESSTYEVGDVVTYIEKTGATESLITHRIIRKTNEGYITQGDANNTPDKAVVKQSQVLGKVFAKIPGIGVTIAFLRKPMGTLAMLLLALLFLELPYQLRTHTRIATEEQKSAAVARLDRRGGFVPPDADAVAYAEFEDRLKRSGITATDPNKPVPKKHRFFWNHENKEKKKKRNKIYVPEEGQWSL